MIIREIAGEHILIPVGKAALKIHGMIGLSESGLLLWKELQQDRSEEDLVESILKEYDIDRETATKDVRMFLKKMRDIDMIIESDGKIE